MIAYFILVHRYPNQFKRMFQAIYTAKNQYLIHIDKKAGSHLHLQIENFLSLYPNAQILKSQNVVWGGYSMVDVELHGIAQLLKTNKKWKYYINLSGQDFPLKSQIDIQALLDDTESVSYMKVANQVLKRPNTLNRIHNYFTETEKGFFGTPIKREYLKKTTAYIGGQWKILSRDACEFITTSPEVETFRNFYKNTLIPDESFFQTVLKNTSFAGKIINDDKRSIIWVPDLGPKLLAKKFTENTTKSLVASGKIKLRPKTFTLSDRAYLLKSEAFFARKFDESIDSSILDLLESRLELKHPDRISSFTFSYPSDPASVL